MSDLTARDLNLRPPAPETNALPFDQMADYFFPRIQVKIPSPPKKIKKKVFFTKNGRLFSPNLSGDQRSDADQSQIIGGDADAYHTHIIGGGGGGVTVKL